MGKKKRPSPGTAPRPEPTPAQHPVNPVYYEALERQLQTMRFMKQMRPFETVYRHVTREHADDLLGGGRTLHPSQLKPSVDSDTLVAEALAYAAPYYWDRNMVDLLEQTASDMPGWQLSQEDLSTPAGYMWLARPLRVMEGDGDFLCAFAWCSVQRDNQPGYMVVPFTRYDGPDQTVIRADHGTPRTPLFWVLGQSVGDYDEAVDNLYADPDYRKGVRAIAGMPARMHQEQIRRFARIFATMVALINQPLLIESGRYQGDRAARRRAQATGQPIPEQGLVRAIVLRRRIYTGSQHQADGDREPIDWQYRWTVRTHWRRQWYPSENRHKSILILMHTKGPEGKPIKASQPIGWVKR